MDADTSDTGPTRSPRKGSPKQRKAKPPKPPRAAPAQLTPAIAASIVRSLQRGSSLAAAAALAGVPMSTLSRWISLGRNTAHGPYRDFADAVELARAPHLAAQNARVEANKAKRERDKAWKRMSLEEREQDLRRMLASRTSRQRTVEGTIVEDTVIREE